MKDIGVYETNARLSCVQSNGFFVAAGIALVFCVSFALSEISAGSSAQTIELEYRINPNDASAASLMRLPGVGLARANAIVEYRRQFQKNSQGVPAFQRCGDLQNIKGIGPATTRDMCEWLKFK